MFSLGTIVLIFKFGILITVFNDVKFLHFVFYVIRFMYFYSFKILLMFAQP